jgi:hypothetical protein
VDDIDQIVDAYVDESEIDFIALPQIVSAVRWRLGAKTDAETREFSLKIAKRLYDKGLRPGDYYLGTRFDYWPDKGGEMMLDRIEREWITAGADPNLAEPICWFAPNPK